MKKEQNIFISLFAVLASASVLNAAIPGMAFAQTSNESSISLSADEMEYNQNSTMVTARGNVEIHQEDRTLIADTVTYDRTKNIIGAFGNVVMHNPNGDVYFANEMEVTGD